MAPYPSLSAIQFPGHLRDRDDPSLAIAALGGEASLRAAQTLSTTLTLNLRPGVHASRSNITSEKPISHTRLYVLELPNHSHSDVLSLGPGVASAEQSRIKGRITSFTSFSTLADYQYHVRPSTCGEVAINSAAANDVFEALRDYPLCKSLMHIERLRPIRFARTAPELGNADYWFKQYCGLPDATTGRIALVAGRPLGDDRRSDVNRLSMLHHRVKMDAESIPRKPPRVDTTGMVRGREAYHRLYELISKLFEIRPVWIRRALYEGIPEDLRRSFKRVISRIAYSFQGPGPFYQAWIRYGYDPRTDADARQYQVVEIRITNAVILAAALERREMELAGGVKRRETIDDEKYPEPFRLPASFTLSQIPSKKVNFIQIRDISLKEVVQVCEEEEVAETFNYKYGFFSEAGFQRLTKCVKATLVQMSRNMLGEERARQIEKGDYSSLGPHLSKRRRRMFLKDVLRPTEEEMEMRGEDGEGVNVRGEKDGEKGEEEEGVGMGVEEGNEETDVVGDVDILEAVCAVADLEEEDCDGRQERMLEVDDGDLDEVEAYEIIGDDDDDDDEDEEDEEDDEVGVLEVGDMDLEDEGMEDEELEC